MSLWDKILTGVGKAFGATNPIGGLLSAGSTLAGGLSAIGQLKRQKKMADYEQQLAKQMYEQQWADQQAQYERELADQRKLIQEEREYNDFSSVMARASKAGINKLAALGQSTGIGMQSSAGSAPSASTPSASSGRVGSPDNIGSTLINAGSTLTAQIRQQELLSAEKRKLEAEAETKEIEAYWKGRDMESIILNREEQTKLYSAGIKEKEAQTRWYTLDGDLKKQLEEFNATMNPLLLENMKQANKQKELIAKKLTFETEHQEEAFRAELNKTKNEAYAAYESVQARYKELELKGKELGLTEKQIEEVRQKRLQNERQFAITQSFYERNETKKLNHQIRIGYVAEANKLLGTCADSMTDLIKAGVDLVDAIVPM